MWCRVHIIEKTFCFKSVVSKANLEGNQGQRQGLKFEIRLMFSPNLISCSWPHSIKDRKFFESYSIKKTQNPPSWPLVLEKSALKIYIYTFTRTMSKLQSVHEILYLEQCWLDLVQKIFDLQYFFSLSLEQHLFLFL